LNLAKRHMDVALFTNRRDEQLEFWQKTVGLEFDHLAKLGGGIHQLRHHVNGSILKINHVRDPLPPAPPSGIVRVRMVRDGLRSRRELIDPDGNSVLLVPAGDDGVTGIAIELAVNNRSAHDRFWREAMQFPSPGRGAYLCGNTRIMIAGESRVYRHNDWRALGWRYTTVQVHDCLAEHVGVLERGGEEGRAPRDLGQQIRFSFVRDPDGNFIELSERVSLTGKAI
jgi:catechol 2,3-dioxygenase-like lactoylglutathione lyase family enzyme